MRKKLFRQMSLILALCFAFSILPLAARPLPDVVFPEVGDNRPANGLREEQEVDVDADFCVLLENIGVLEGISTDNASLLGTVTAGEFAALWLAALQNRFCGGRRLFRRVGNCQENGRCGL